MREKLYDMMYRHAASMYSSEELTLLKAQISDLMDCLDPDANEKMSTVDHRLLEIFVTMNILYARLKLIKMVADVAQKQEPLWEWEMPNE